MTETFFRFVPLTVLITVMVHFEDINHFLVYAAGVTANDMMADSLLHRLVGRGF